MSKIGNWGKTLVFAVHTEKGSLKNPYILTFDTLNQDVKGRWATHQPIGGKPYSEFLGADQRQISMTITIRADYGVKPKVLLRKLEKAVEKGTPHPLVIGGEKIGKNNWVISSMSEKWGHVYSKGELYSVTMNLTFSEYR